MMRAAASSMRLDVLDLVTGLPGAPGFNGSGGGALSGSELSHLASHQSKGRRGKSWARTHMGTELLPDSENECWCFTIRDSARSREGSLELFEKVDMVTVLWRNDAVN